MEEEAKRDRISEMPQEIKQQILSSLSMKDAVSTSSLSSLWRYSWVSLPFIDFGYDVFRQFSSFFHTLPTTHPKKRHLYSVFHEEEEEEEDDSESTVDDTVDDFDYDYDYDDDDVYNDWVLKHDWEIDRVGYLQMLDQILQVYIKKNESLKVLKKMSLYVPMLSDSKMRDYGADVVSRCLSLAKLNVDELIYWYHHSDSPQDSYDALRNCLPILESKTLTKLMLHGCYLASEIKWDLPNLKHLSLIMFVVDYKILDTLLAKCRALETLELSSCKGLKVLRVPRLSKLKELKVNHTLDLDLVEINAMALQCLNLVKLKGNKCKVKMAPNSCNNLVELLVNGCAITDGFFNNVAQFPHLKTLFLIDCPKLKHIKITSKCLTSFNIKDCPNLSQAELDTPKLFFIGYSSSSNNRIRTYAIPRASLLFKRPRAVTFDKLLWHFEHMVLLTSFRQSKDVQFTIKPKEVNFVSFSYFFPPCM
ncbi:hypothetical protein RND81_13G066800 [Saponaria officinalis]|uniref:F-box domain-containing protein n=1 Tax=Saponaria officinalis TaxID=3572 RepID=A0AAW1GWT9_SAPOF